MLVDARAVVRTATSGIELSRRKIECQVVLATPADDGRDRLVEAGEMLDSSVVQVVSPALVDGVSTEFANGVSRDGRQGPVWRGLRYESECSWNCLIEAGTHRSSVVQGTRLDDPLESRVLESRVTPQSETVSGSWCDC